MSKVALVIIFNHRYDGNIDILERLYQDRFSHIYHLVPFYDGSKSNVIAVYGNSRYFQGYIAQGFSRFFSETYTHYLFIADDLILNPAVNEYNYQEMLGLNDKSSFLEQFISFHKLKSFWHRAKEAYEYKARKDGVEISREIPSCQEALALFSRFGLEIKPLAFHQIYTAQHLHVSPEQFAILQNKYSNTAFNLSYPLVGSYSDICVVSSGSIKKFCHYCGVFAATELFAEIALPTAQVLSASEIATQENAKLRGMAMWDSDEKKRIFCQFGGDIKNLLNHFPPQCLYLHPIKLSQWNTGR